MKGVVTGILGAAIVGLLMTLSRAPSSTCSRVRSRCRWKAARRSPFVRGRSRALGLATPEELEG